MRSLIKYVLLTSVLLVPLHAFGAETVKLRYLSVVANDDKEGQLKNPEGVACNDASLLVVADTGNGRLLRYTFQDKALKGGAEIKVPQLAYPVRVQLSSKGDMYVLDGKQRKIVHLTPEGGFAGFLEPQGVTAPPAFVPRSFKIDTHDAIYLLDILGERVLVLDPAGKLLRQVSFPKDYGSFSDLAVSLGGDILLVDSVNSMVFIAQKDAATFTPLTKSMRDYMNFPTYIMAGSRGEFYLVDQDGGSIVIMGQDGSFQGRQLGLGWKSGALYYPAQVCMNNNGEFFIADRNNSRVQIFEVVR